MRAFVITAPRTGCVVDVPEPEVGRDTVLLDVERVGVCGTDTELFTGDMAYLATGETSYPIRIGHEFCGVVTGVGADVDPAWLGRRAVVDMIVGCGACDRCLAGRTHVCAQRAEIGVRDGWAGAVAERVAIPARSLLELPPSLGPALGALVEPAGNAYRAVLAAQLQRGERLLIAGTGTIGLLAAQIARAHGIDVHLLGVDVSVAELTTALGLDHVWTATTLPELRWDAVIDATNDPALPATAIELVELGRRVVCIGLAGEASTIDTRAATLKDVTIVGILGGSAGLAPVIELFTAGLVDPLPLVAGTVTLDDVASILAGVRRPEWGSRPKVHIDPRIAGSTS